MKGKLRTVGDVEQGDLLLAHLDGRGYFDPGHSEAALVQVMMRFPGVGGVAVRRVTLDDEGYFATRAEGRADHHVLADGQLVQWLGPARYRPYLGGNAEVVDPLTVGRE